MRRSMISILAIGAVALSLPACQRNRTEPASEAQRGRVDTMARAERPDAVTPMDQGSSDQDLQVTRQVRQAITSDDSLSSEARNVKIVTDGGGVVLRGPVQSLQEKEAIVAIATRTPGVTRVDDQLDVARD